VKQQGPLTEDTIRPSRDCSQDTIRATYWTREPEEPFGRSRVASTTTAGLPAQLDTLAERINAEHEACEAAARSAIEHAIEAGRLLTEAKKKVAHGTWLMWIAANCSCSERTAQVYMRIYRHRDKLGSDTQRVADLSVRQALTDISNQYIAQRVAESRDKRKRQWELQHEDRAVAETLGVIIESRQALHRVRSEPVLLSKFSPEAARFAGRWCELLVEEAEEFALAVDRATHDRTETLEQWKDTARNRSVFKAEANRVEKGLATLWGCARGLGLVVRFERAIRAKPERVEGWIEELADAEKKIRAARWSLRALAEQMNASTTSDETNGSDQ